MNISIFGLGYVGCVGMGCLASNGHEVIGVDVQQQKVDLINQGRPTIVEKDIDQILGEQFEKKKISATSHALEAVLATEVSIICVGTPSTSRGHLNLEYIFQTAAQIGQALKAKNTFHVVAIRSTVLPGTNDKVCAIIAQESGKRRNVDFSVVSNPEFLREGSAVEDYFNPPMTVLGGDNEKALDIMSKLYTGINGPVEFVDIQVAETIKYVNNSFHALKVAFANEVGNICKQLDIDSHEVMRLFCMDRQLNISPVYFKPGFAYGGSCLPKDLKALNTLAHDLYLESPVLNAIDISNEKQKNRALDLIVQTQKRRIGILGLSFKAGTDDLRNSPIVDVIETLNGKGYEIRIYDRNVSLSRLVGKNKSFIEEKLPHLCNMMQGDINRVLEWAEVIVIANRDDMFQEILPRRDQKIIDLVRITRHENKGGYEGICW
ncbi:MAG: UDP-glucose/GDP-mannose dehydrogenase family protein [Desulfobacterales bacterium]|nr:UDP-glucose/GDP-mannose dehydrogenase family protein [Desulfobacterales bacterium]